MVSSKFEDVSLFAGDRFDGPLNGKIRNLTIVDPEGSILVWVRGVIKKILQTKLDYTFEQQRGKRHKMTTSEYILIGNLNSV